MSAVITAQPCRWLLLATLNSSTITSQAANAALSSGVCFLCTAHMPCVALTAKLCGWQHTMIKQQQQQLDSKQEHCELLVLH
jgi:hypothetical protein